MAFPIRAPSSAPLQPKAEKHEPHCRLVARGFQAAPGLYRRWELTEVCEPNRNYQIEDAGTHADGTPLLAIYVRDAAPDAREAA
jgi:hypothetical protein